MGRTIVGLQAQIDATAALAAASAAQGDADQALLDAAKDTPISISVDTTATNDSTELLAAGATGLKITGRVTAEYSAGATATISLYSASGSTTFPAAAVWDIGEVAVGEEWQIDIDAVNLTNARSLRVEIGGTPVAGGSDWFLTRAAAPLA